MFRKPKKAKSKASFRRKKKPSGDDNGNEDGASKKAFRKRSAGDNDESSSDDDGSGEGTTTSGLLDQIRRDKESSRVKKRRTAGGSDDDEAGGGDDGGKGGAKAKGGGGGGGGGMIMHEYKSADPSLQMTATEMATRGAEHHPEEITRNGAAPASASLDKAADDRGGGTTAEGGGDGIYKGNAQKRNKFLAGPLKAPTFVRTTCRFDYQPDICKDYKDTGFCGFGDTCIYLHDRGDTMAGWQMEQQYEEKKKKEAERKEREMEKFLNRANGIGGTAGGSDSDSEDGEKKADDGIPFACHLCRGPFNDPVVTSCGHYFCQNCILDRVRGSAGEGAEGGDATCPVCTKDTHGVFNAPSKLETKKKRTVGRDGTWEDFLEASRKKKRGKGGESDVAED